MKVSVTVGNRDMSTATGLRCGEAFTSSPAGAFSVSVGIERDQLI
jgi:hypothetical protein